MKRRRKFSSGSRRISNRRWILSIVAFLTFFGVLYAQVVQPSFAGYGNLSGVNMQTLRVPGKPSRVLRSSVSRISYLRRVGGVAFEQTALPAGLARVYRLIYDSRREDGKRLIAIGRGNKKYVVPLHDWELKPTFMFADDASTYSLVTLFGGTGNDLEDNQLRAKNKKIKHMISFNASIKDTLMGWRILQMDAFRAMSAADYVKLPGTPAPFLGPGENITRPFGFKAKGPYTSARVRDIQKSAGAAMDILTLYSQRRSGKRHAAYLVTDMPRYVGQFRFRMSNGIVQLDGNPYFYFWKSTPRLVLRRFLARARFDRIFNSAAWSTREASDNRMWKIFQDTFQSMEEGRKFLQRHGGLAAISRDAVYRKAYEELQDADHLPILSRTISRNHEIIRDHNPVVFDATRKLMRYAAFFRYCKKRVRGYSRVKSRIKRIKIPRVITPNVSFKKEKPPARKPANKNPDSEPGKKNPGAKKTEPANRERPDSGG